MDKIPTDLLGGCFRFFEEEIRFSTFPKKNKKNLEKEMEDLKSMLDVVTTIFQEQEQTQPGTECKVVVKGWLAKVNGIETEVKTHLDKLAESRSCTCCCSPHVNYLLGKEVDRLIEQVRRLVEERRSFDDDNLVRPIPPHPINNVPDLSTTMVGRDGKSSEIQGYLSDSKVTTIADDKNLVRPIPADPIDSVPDQSTAMVGRDGKSSKIQGYLSDSQVTTIADDKNLVRPIPVDPIDSVPDQSTTMVGRDGKSSKIQGYLSDSQVTTIVDDKNLVRPIPVDPIDSVPDQSTTMVGRDGKSSKIQGYLSDSQVTTIGILGTSFDDKNLVRPIPPDPIDNVPDLSTAMVGRDGKLLEIQGYLRDSEVTTIGICGIGGIGKTTMLKSIKQWLSGNDHDFHYIIWIEMSHNEDDILKIQKRIANCIFLSLPSEHEEKENKEKLANALRSRKSLVLIDNVWEKLDFERIGIPFAVGFVKILFTTRSEGVCHDMRAQKIVRLDSLEEAESLQLFKTNISLYVHLTDKIVRQLVDEILRICGGVPLVIVTVARTVANYTQVEEWIDAVECLRSSREEIEGMNELMKCLKFSYDKLEDDKIKSCLLNLSLYPEGYQVTRDELIKQWLAEGFLDTPSNSFKRSYERGVVNINKLELICFVEKSVVYDDCVELHNEIRHMLCWIREHENKEVFIEYTEVSDGNYDGWDLAKRIFLQERQVNGLPETGMPLCPNLTSLFVKGEYEDFPNRIGKLPTEDFFHFTPSLRVLNLSCTGLVDIPKSIGKLVELRYLNLYSTRIHTLPMELANLKKLKCLDLGDTVELVTIVGSAISQLSTLQSLNLFNTSYQWKSDDVDMTTQHPLLKLEDLRELKNLEDLGVDVWSNSHLDTILCDEKFLESIARISFIQIDFTTVDPGGLQLIEWISHRLPKLMHLIVDDCDLATDILEIKDDHLPHVTQLCLWNLKILSVTLNDAFRPFNILKVLQIIGCQRLKEVSWTACLPSLENLEVKNCISVKELVEEKEEEEIREFPKLYRLKIKDSENLERIRGRSSLLFPALRHLIIENYPKLKHLSFGDDTAKNMEYIKCEKTQWDLLEWENDQIRVKFSPYVRHSL